MIISFSVQNFGSIKEKQTLSFEADKSEHLEDYYVIQAPNGMRLLKLAMIYGANASGKTTVLKALDFLRKLVLEPEEKKTDSLDFEPFLFDSKTPQQNSFFELDFIAGDIRYTYEVEFNKKCVVSEKLVNYDPNKAKVYTRTTDTSSELTKIAFGNKIKKDKNAIKSLEANTLWNNTVFGGFLKTNIDIADFKYIQDWFSYKQQDLITKNVSLRQRVISLVSDSMISKSSVIKILNKADLNISDFKIDEEEFKNLNTIVKLSKFLKVGFSNLKVNLDVHVDFVHKVENGLYKLSYDLESEGTKRYFGFAGILAFMMQYGTIFCIDELEDSLHPDLYNHFLLTFLVNAKNSQMITSTHNREILKDKNIFRNDAIWFTDKSNESCATELYSLADFDSSVVRDTSNVYNAYKIGKLGGVPNLGDYYIDLEDEKE